jgi:hypothetical protein
MWVDLKFAVDPRSGDTKPIKPELIGSSSRMGSRFAVSSPLPFSVTRSLLSKSNEEFSHKYGLVGEDQKSSKSRKVEL